MATVVINGLDCQDTYMITAAGTLDGELVGPKSTTLTVNEIYTYLKLYTQIYTCSMKPYSVKQYSMKPYSMKPYNMGQYSRKPYV